MPTSRSVIALCADGGGELGSGHVTRCAVLAEALEAQGADAVWLTRTPDMAHAFEPPLQSIRNIHAITSPAAFRDQLDRLGVTLMVADWAKTPTGFVDAARESGRPVAALGRNIGHTPVDCQILQDFSDPDHLLIAPDFRPSPDRQFSGPARRLLVALGGSDPDVLENLRDVVSDMADLAELKIDWASGDRKSPNRRDFARRMQAADLALLAGGTSLHEAAASGLPFLCFPIAENQSLRADQVEARGLGPVVRPYRSGWEKELQSALADLIHDPDRRAALSRQGSALVDGRGAQRVAARLLAAV